MVNRAKPPQEVFDTWASLLTDAVEDLQSKRAAEHRAQDFMRTVVRDAFDAGLSASKIREITGMSIGRLYQIKRGKRL